MNPILKEVLFSKHILVENGKGEDQVATLYAMLDKLGIRITAGFEMANVNVMRFAQHMLGEYVPSSFYIGFPDTVRELTPRQLLFDQLVHYTQTYGFGDFEQVGHSLFEYAVARRRYEEESEPQDFIILSEEDAKDEVFEIVDSLLESSRPLNVNQQHIVLTAIEELGYSVKNISSKQTAIELLYRTKDLQFTKFITLSDIPKLAEFIQYFQYYQKNVNNLRWRNTDRKFVTRVLDKLLERKYSADNMAVCIEKRATWKGLLHHIHYKPKSENAKEIISFIYDDDIRSHYSVIERQINFATISVANYLKEKKGNGALLRNLNYILSRTPSSKINSVLSLIDAKSPLIILQMLNMYRNYSSAPRTFKFTRHETVVTHKETERKNALSPETVKHVVTILENKLYESLSGKVGKVYIAPGMEKIAVPINMSAGESGYGIMPTGSRIPMPKGKKIRAFTYWEKVNDIDLSCIGVDKDMNMTEFSWRTMHNRQSDAITYSGDETSGYNGGSEYFDVDIDAVKKRYPKLKYVIFCDNVFSGKNFSEVVCRAGWMSRDILDSGEVYEPKTVKSAYVINAKTTFAYLFAVDLETREIIWLNLADDRKSRVAGVNSMDWLAQYFTMCETMNMAKLFRYAATTVVDKPEDADLVVGDIETDKEQIKSFEFEKAFKYFS